MLTASLILASVLGQAPAAAEPAKPAKAATATKAAAPKVLSPEEKAIQQATLRVTEARAAYQKPGLSPKEKARRKKAVLRAEEYARSVRSSVNDKTMQQQQAAYIEKMMPIWQEQQRLNAQFSIEAARAAALQQMANTPAPQPVQIPSSPY